MINNGKNTKTVAVIMACHNRCQYTLSCLKSLSEQTLHDGTVFEIFLLDDGSTDNTPESVRKGFPDTHIIEGDGSLFWNRGMHKAFSAAIQKGFDYYLWLNDDCVLYENTLEVLFNTSKELEARGYTCTIIGSAMQDPGNGSFSYGGVRRHRSKWGRVKLKRIAPSNVAIRCDATNGNCVLIPAGVVEKVGNLDPIFLHRWGDHDYCFRALQRGCTVWLAPGYLGTCSENSIEGTWEDTSLPMVVRMRKLNSPRGFQFHDYSIYLKRHRGPWWPVHLIWPYIKIILQSVRP